MSLATNYTDVLNAIAALLGTIAVGAVVTRNFKDLDDYSDAEQQAGVFTVILGPRQGYGYEYRPGELARVTIWIYVEQRLPGDPSGVEIEDAEIVLSRHLEELANQAPEQDELLCPLTLQSIVGSAQTTPPIASVVGQFIFGVER